MEIPAAGERHLPPVVVSDEARQQHAVTREMDFGGIGELADVLNEWLELKRREKKEYLKKEEMISDTYTNLSHDIRTPLTSLDGYFQLMETCEDQEEQRRYMKIIQERIGSLKEMLEELFTFIKILKTILFIWKCSFLLYQQDFERYHIFLLR